ncbi:MAG: LysM peptidoglycan-binding domain-containing protein, partial [Lachnospiraceae bacterium]|nr:LysM peptidoglycan-binding domain-containing protein [Lachnospiraceae bacterium]
KYYLYGAGQQREITYFAQYELLEEIACRPAPDMPVFFIQKGNEMYELAGYYIFYQSNEAMQNYMVEQRKTAEAGDRMRNRERVQAGSKPADPRKIVRPQNIVRSQSNNRTQSNRAQTINGEQDVEEAPQKTSWGSGKQFGERLTGKPKGGLMAVQLSAIFVILIAIVINSTNSYTKLEELNQAAVEVFFAMENEEAAGTNAETDGTAETDADAETENAVGLDIPTEGTVLRLADLDAKFEEENQTAKLEETENDKTEEVDGSEKQSGEENMNEQGDEEGSVESGKNSGENGQEGSSAEQGKEVASTEELAPSEQAFARNFAEYYKIEKGDTLYKISIKIYGDTGKVKEICELNKIKDPDNIKYGQKILLP